MEAKNTVIISGTEALARGEMVNLAVDRRYEAELNRLRRAMYDWGVRIGDPKLVRNLRPWAESRN